VPGVLFYEVPAAVMPFLDWEDVKEGEWDLDALKLRGCPWPPEGAEMSIHEYLVMNVVSAICDAPTRFGEEYAEMAGTSGEA